MANTTVTITHPHDTVVIEYPPEWRVKVIEKHVSNPADTIDINNTVGVKVIYAPAEAYDN